MSVSKTSQWQALQQHQQQLAQTTLSNLFANNPYRFEHFNCKMPGLLLDYSKQRVTDQTVQLLVDLAVASDLSKAINDMFNGAIVNHTEKRPALHSELRKPNPRPEVTQVLAQMREFTSKIQEWDITDVIVLGIGGSDLGPRLVCEALKPFKTSELHMHFIANVDGDTITHLLSKLAPKNTLCIINSKTFTTIETLANAQTIKSWLLKSGLNQKQLAEHLVAVSANKEQAISFGIDPENIFEFWDWVGGRYSVWSAVGLPIALTIGMDNFERFLSGAHEMDEHFRTADFAHNLPVIMGLIGIWNINFNHYPTLAIKPYADGLRLLPDYLQQLEMESNGKSAANNGDVVSYQTAPVIWGGVGCNGQHAYMQMLHQGTQTVPVDFLVARSSINGPAELHNLLVASCLGQSQALMSGRTNEQNYKTCPGNKPSTTLMFDQLTPEILGNIIALYEHKVFVQGTIWQIQSFDQWGVQLGKDLIKDILQLIENHDMQYVDSSTAGLLSYFKQA